MTKDFSNWQSLTHVIIISDLVWYDFSMENDGGIVCYHYVWYKRHPFCNQCLLMRFMIGLTNFDFDVPTFRSRLQDVR